mgnify:FL=1
MLDRYKNEKDLVVVFNVDTKTTTIKQNKVDLESIDFSSLKSAKDIAKYLGLKTVTQYKLSKATFNIDGSKRGYTAFREENNNG